MLKTSGFVLRRNNYREYDRIYTVYTSDFGKVSLLARGARKIKSKLAPHLESFSEVRVNFARGKVFTHLSGAAVLENYNFILKDAGRMELAGQCLGLLEKFIKYDEADKEIYGLLGKIISAANEAETKDFWKIRVYFFWRLVDLLGYRPQLDECALCGKIEFPPHLFRGEDRGGVKNSGNAPSSSPSKEGERKNLKFNITENIIICGECVGDGFHIQENTLENLRKIFQFNLAGFLKIEMDGQLFAITEKARQIKLSEL